MSSVRAVLFDFGNTLFAHDSLSATIRRLADDLGTPLGSNLADELAEQIDSAAHTSAELRHPRDLDADVWQSRWRMLYGLADVEVAGLGAALLADMHDPGRWLPYPATGEVLRALHAAGVRVGVVSNTGWNVRVAFERHGFADLIDAYTLSYEAGCTKPDPRIFEIACAALDVDPDLTLMVGDDPRADSGAVRAGIPVLLLPPPAPAADNGLRTVLDLAL